MSPTVFWLIAVVALVVGEVATVGLVCIWFAVGALAGLLAAVLGGEVWLQLVVFVAVSALALALVRPAVSRVIRPRRSPTNADRVVGKRGVVTQTIDNAAAQGQINVLGQVWTARSQNDLVIPQGTQVVVLRIEGVKVFVDPAESGSAGTT